MIKSLAILLLSAVACLSQTYSVALTYTFEPGDPLTNYTFVIHSSTNSVAPMPWEVLTATCGTNQFSVTVDAKVGCMFFYTEVRDNRNGPHYYAEPIFSEIVTNRILPRGEMMITGRH